MFTINSLPNEVSLFIIHNLTCSFSSVVAISLASRKWYQLCNNPSVWRHIYKNSFDVAAYLRRSPELHIADIDWKTKYRLRLELLREMKKCFIINSKDAYKYSSYMRGLWELANENDGLNSYYLKNHLIQQTCVDILKVALCNIDPIVYNPHYMETFSFGIGAISMLTSWGPIPILFSSDLSLYFRLRDFVHGRHFCSKLLITATHAIHVYILICFHRSILEELPPTLIPNSTYFDTPKNAEEYAGLDPLNYISVPYQKFTGQWIGCYSYRRQLMEITRLEDERGDIMRMDIRFSDCNTSCICASSSVGHPSHFCGRGRDSVGGYSILNGTCDYDGKVKFIKTYDDTFSWHYNGHMCPQGILGRWGDIYGHEIGGCFWIWKVND